MKISTSLNVFDTAVPIEQQIERCVRAGFQAIDLNYCDYQKVLLEQTWEEEERWAHRMRAAADRYGISFGQMHGPIHGSFFLHDMFMGMNLESFQELANRSLQTAAIIGVKWIVFHPTRISSGDAYTRQETEAYNAQFFSGFLPQLEQSGVGIALENLFVYRPGEWYYSTNPEELVQLVDRINHPLVGICWDTGHGHMQRHDPSVAIPQFGSRLKAVHIQDTDPTLDQHLLPYHGTVDWQKTMQALREVNYTGDFTYEVHNAIRKVPDHLRDPLLHYAVQLAQSLIGEDRI